MFTVCLVFQFVRMTFLAIARATSVGFVCFGGSSTDDKSPSMRNEGERGMLQPKTEDSFCVTFKQMCCTSGAIRSGGGLWCLECIVNIYLCWRDPFYAFCFE